MTKIRKNVTVADRVINLNWKLISIVFFLSLIGIFMLYSAAGGSLKPWAFRQIIHFAVFFPVMIIIALIDINLLYKYSYWLYFFAVFLLIAVAISGYNSMGATRWLRIGPINIQPSEITKLFVIFAIARFFHSLSFNETIKYRAIFFVLLLIALPTILILKQPDLGTALILLIACFMTLFVCPINIGFFILSGILAVSAIPMMWFMVLKEYQKNRVITFLNPGRDPLGDGYNIIQSKIAIGSGGLSGKGFLKGTQGQLDFLPERQTDFIFTMLAEEFGFLGGMTVIVLYSIIFVMSISIALKAKSHFGKLLAMGIASLLFAHFFINIAMTLGMLPVVGAPLPLLSYGGTITASTLIAFGVLLNIGINYNVKLSDEKSHIALLFK